MPLTVHKPEFDELRFRQALLADEATMAYNRAWGGTIPFPKERWREWYALWVEGSENERYYRYLADERGRFVGEIAYHFDRGLNGYAANVIIFSECRGRGYGGEALELLCSAARENGVAVLYDDIALDNPAVRLFLGHGFSEVCRTEEKIILKKEL